MKSASRFWTYMPSATILVLGLSVWFVACFAQTPADASGGLREAGTGGYSSVHDDLEQRFQEYTASAGRYYERGERAVFSDISTVGVIVGNIRGLYGPAATYYVDGARGTDAPGFGSYTGFQAYSSLDYAWRQIPANFTGDQHIYVAAGEYAGTHQLIAKTPAGDCTITISGSLSRTDDISCNGGVQGSGATQGTVTGTFTSGQYDNQLLYCSSGSNAGVYRVVDSNTASTITIVGTWPNGAPAAGDEFFVYDWATRFKGSDDTFYVSNGQKGVSIYDLGLESKATTALHVTDGGNVQLTRCSITRLTQIDTFGSVLCDTCIVKRNSGATNRVCQISGPGILRCADTKIDCDSMGNISGIYADNGGLASLSAGTIIDGASGSGKGLELTDSGYALLYTTTASGLNKIRNFTIGYGIHSTYNSVAGKVTGYVTLTGNSTDTYTSNSGYIH